MHVLIQAYSRLLADIGKLSGVRLDSPIDIPLSWVLIEGPLLDKSVLRFIEEGGVEPSFPEWLLPLWEKFLFYHRRHLNGDSDQGEELLKYLRMALVFCYKAEYEPTKEQCEETESSFIHTDNEVGFWNSVFFRQNPNDAVLTTARRLVGLVIGKIDWLEITPSHGPGAVFPPRRPCDKSDLRVTYPTIQRYYPMDRYFCGLPSFWDEILWKGDSRIAEVSRIQCRTQLVPKDSRGPRLICVHPVESIWIQQGQRRLLEDAISRSQLTSKNIKFNDQSVNGKIALASSLSREYCTLDLKEASDRIGTELVRHLFGGAYQWIECARAQDVVLSNGRVHELQKYAPMGNCLTFPVQSLIFWSLVRAGIYHRHGIHCDGVYVFGDDILFPTEYYEGALDGLVRCGLVPNLNKTFRKGFFRESCGVDAYHGIDITPLRIRRRQCISVSDAISLVETAHRLLRDNFEHCAAYIYSVVRKWLGDTYGYDLPLSNNPDTRGLYEYVRDSSPILRNGMFRINRNLHRLETPVILASPAVYRVRNGDWYHLQDSLLSLELCSTPCRERCTEYPVPYRDRLHKGWTPLL